MAEVFVFGSNLAGRHGAGSAKEALRNWGAIYGQGTGRQGNSYAIPTKDQKLWTLPLHTISVHVSAFKAYAEANPEDTFTVVAIGCGLAGYKPEQIGSMFVRMPPNVQLPPEFLPFV